MGSVNLKFSASLLVGQIKMLHSGIQSSGKTHQNFTLYTLYWLWSKTSETARQAYQYMEEKVGSKITSWQANDNYLQVIT